MGIDIAGGDAVAGYTFQIEIDGVSMAQFKEVSGLSAEIQVIEHRENKLGGLALMKQLPGAKKFGPITLKHGKTNDKALWDWIKEVQDGNIETARRNGSVVLYDYARGEVGRFNFVNGWPSKVSIGALSASGNDILVEECTIVHEGLAPA
ncbi:MAG TPA: phage tail protein [Actinomycetota bacterium]|nr:phage tail protein [Actinomycetota bacterium]